MSHEGVLMLTCAVPVSQKCQAISKPAQNGDLLTVQQVADLLQYSRHTVYVWICKNQLPISYHKFPRGVRFKRSEVDRWIESRKVMPVKEL
jgi:excisionase family DNA binding protein